MSAKPFDNGGPVSAQPCVLADGRLDFSVEHGWGGMSLADYYAGQALCGLTSHHNGDGEDCSEPCASVAKDAYAYADALIAEKRRRESSVPNVA